MLVPIQTKPQDGAFVPAPITDEEAAAGLRAVIAIFAKWDLSDPQASQLLDLSMRSWTRWKTTASGPGNGRWTRDLKARLSNILGIHQALRIVFREPERGYRWISQPNEAFGGKSAIDVMANGELTDLMRVRHYLDAERGGW